MNAPPRGHEGGAAVVEFVLVTVLLVTLFLGVMQVGLALHVRNTLAACAADGARFGANADRGPADAAVQTRLLIRGALSDRMADNVTSGYEMVDGVQTVYVEVRTSLPVLGLLGPSRAMQVRGHAVAELP